MDKPELPSEQHLITPNLKPAGDASDNSQNILDSDLIKTTKLTPKLTPKQKIKLIQSKIDLINKLDPLAIIKKLSHDTTSSEIDLLSNFTTDIAPSDLFDTGDKQLEDKFPVNHANQSQESNMNKESMADQIKEEHYEYLQEILNERNEEMSKALKLRGLKMELAERWAKAESSQAKAG